MTLIYNGCYHKWQDAIQLFEIFGFFKHATNLYIVLTTRKEKTWEKEHTMS